MLLVQVYLLPPLKLLNEHNHQLVHLWMNKDIEIHDFDADPGWLET